MSLSVNINLNVPALPDNGIAFANNAAWMNYWSSIQLVGTFDAIANTKYTEAVYDNSLSSVVLDIDGVQKTIATKEQLDSLVAAYQTLNINYKNLLNTLKAAGLLTESI